MCKVNYIATKDGELIIKRIHTLQKRINALVKYARTQISKT